MSGQRNISIEIPLFLLEQIKQRTLISQRSQNAEFRYLLHFILEQVSATEDFDFRNLEGERKQTTVRLDYETAELLRDRCWKFHRSMGREIVRLVAYAIDTIAKRDLETQADMVRRAARTAS